MPKRLRATLLHIVYSKSKKIAIVFIIFLEKSITLSLSSPLLLRISPHTFDFIPIPSMSLSSRKRSIFNAFRHILPCVAPLCEDMHYHKTGVPWQMKSTLIIVLFLLVLPRNALFCKGFRGFVKCVFWMASWQNRARWSKLLRAVSSKVGSKTR